MKNYSTYEVAVMNYPLFDKKMDTNHAGKWLFSDPDHEKAGVPLYIHIPFCDNLCHFCIYNRMHVKPDSSLLQRYTDALVREITSYAAQNYVRQLTIGAVFIGGGTPTVLSAAQLEQLLKALRDSFDLVNVEITVECSASTADQEKLDLLRQNGVTRISTGIQTFDNTVRREMNIQYDSDVVKAWILNAKKIGFDTVSTDILYGLPGTDTETLMKDLREAAALDLEHLSVYKLTPFAYTALYKSIEAGKHRLPDENTIRQMFEVSDSFLKEAGYYLQSTQEYSKLGKTVRFWDETYDGYGNNLSFGMSSFGYLNGFCYQNEPVLENYFEKVESGKFPISRSSRRITEEELMERSMVMGFRRGRVSKKDFMERFGVSIRQKFRSQIEYQINNGMIVENEEWYHLTPKGLYFQGGVSAEYMISVFQGVSPLKKKMCIGSHEMP